MANDYSDLAKRLLQEGGDFHRACSDAIHSLALENKATHQAWKADIEACEAEVKKWKHAYELEYDKVAALKAHHKTMAAAWQKVQEAELNRANRLESENDALKAQIAERDAEIVKQREAKDAAIRLWNECGADLERAEAQAAEYKRDAERYRWWRENIGIIEQDGDGIAGVAYSFQIPLHGLNPNVPEQTDGDLMDAIADAALAAPGEKGPQP